MKNDETRRLQALCALGILDTPAEERFDRITRLAASLFNVPIALISLIDRDRQWFKSRFGMPLAQTGRHLSFCTHVVERRNLLVIPDTHADVRFAASPLVVGAPYIRFYAGQPVRSPEGEVIGTLCLIDTRPRDPGAMDFSLLADLACMAEEEIGKPVAMVRSSFRSGADDTASRRLSLHIEQTPLAAIEWDGEVRVSLWSARARELFGWSAVDVIGRHPGQWRFVHESDAGKVEAAVGRLLNRSQSSNVCHNRNYRKDGSVIECAWHNSAIFDASGKMVSLLSLVQELSGSPQAPRNAGSSPAPLTAAMEQADIGLGHLGLDGRWRWASRRLCDILGYGAEELAECGLADIDHPQAPHRDDPVRRLLTGPEDNLTLERRCRRGNGDDIRVRQTLSLQRGNDGAPAYIVCTMESLCA
ncbi:PAS domain S-box protein [Noviherbaspirillum humi]|uniref:PAS domain S-box protein n=1 Tax=Noviherbaspirillum humi TaxID=1688639 RepID=UPI0015963B57|nr:PAS domain S-box protein [Noviherbaspirillum humi]